MPRQSRDSSPQYRYIGDGPALSAELKRTAHAVREHFDRLPSEMEEVVGTAEDGTPVVRTYNPRKRRLVTIPMEEGNLVVQPGIAPRARHALCCGERQPFHRVRLSRRQPTDAKALKMAHRRAAREGRFMNTGSLRDFARLQVAQGTPVAAAALNWLTSKGVGL
jgi:hypothetical protein